MKTILLLKLKSLSYPAERFDWMQYFYESKALFSTFSQPKLLFSL